MTSRFSFDTEIPPSREIVLNLPGDVPVGPANLEVTVTHSPAKKESTLKDFLNPEFFGMWKDRDDISDSSEFAKLLRERSWSR